MSGSGSGSKSKFSKTEKMGNTTTSLNDKFMSSVILQEKKNIEKIKNKQVIFKHLKI